MTFTPETGDAVNPIDSLSQGGGQPQTPPAQPSSPANPTPNQPTPGANTPTPATAPAPLHSRIFDGVLRTLSGGPTRVQQPDGSIKEVPMSRPALGHTILAGVLAGMFSRDNTTSPGAGGAERNDPGKILSAGFNAGKEEKQHLDDKAQKLVDEQQSRKLLNFQNNSNLMTQMLAVHSRQHSYLDPMVDNNQKGILSAAENYDKSRPDGDPSIFLARGLQADDAMNIFDAQGGKHKLTDTNVILEGTTDVMNPKTGTYEAHPIYSIIRPDAQLKLNEDQVNELAKFMPGMDNAWKLTGGNFNLSAGKYVAMQNLSNSLTHLEGLFTDMADGMGKGPVDLVAAFKQHPQQMRSAVEAAETALAQGGSDDQVIEKLQGTMGGRDLLSLLGTQQEVSEYAQGLSNQRIKESAMAKAQGAFAASGWTENKAKSVLADSNIPEDDPRKIAAQGFLDLGVTQEGKKANAKIEAALPEIQKTAHNVVNGTGLANLTDVVSRSGAERRAMLNTIITEATNRGLDPADYSAPALKAKADTYVDYHDSSKEKSSANQIKSFDTFLSHGSEAYDAAENLKHKQLAGFSTPMFNIPMNKLAKYATGDLDVKRFNDAIVVPGKEFMNFLNANRAEHEGDIKLMGQVLDPNQSPDMIMQAVRDLAKSADARVAAMGRQYLSTMKTTFPGLLTDNGRAGIQKLVGKDSQSIALATQLPQGNDQVLTDPKIVAQYKSIAGGDAAKAVQLARANGWYVPTQDGKYGPTANPPQAAPQQ